MHERGGEPDTLPARRRARSSSSDSASSDPVVPAHSSATSLDESPTRPLVDAKPASAPIGTSWSVAAATAATGVETGPHTARTVESLHLQEVGMSRMYVRIATLFALCLLALLPFIGGHPIAKAVYASGALVTMAASIWFAWRMRDPSGYTIERSVKSALANVYGGFALIYFFGVFSAACMFMPFGIYFYTLKQNDRATRAIFVVSITVYGLMAGGVMAGIVPDVGLLSSDRMGTSDRLAMAILAEITLVITFVVARATRANVRRAVEHQDRLVRDLAKREALLAEARADLERAVESGRLGRFTDVVVGSYRLGTVLGRGGMGEVYEATHVATGTAAAVKMLNARVLANPSAVRSFLHEIHAIAKIDSPHVVRVLEIGGTEAAFPYVAMELLGGKTLSETLRQRKRLPLCDVVELVQQVAAGLEALRAAGIVHRDLKPGNLFRAETADGIPLWKILDLGVSQSPDLPHEPPGHLLVGTPAYMAPEQASRGTVSHRTDVFALGLVAYRALTGRPAFGGSTVHDTLRQVLRDTPPHASELVPVPRAIDAALDGALAKDPDARPSRALDFAAAFALAAS